MTALSLFQLQYVCQEAFSLSKQLLLHAMGYHQLSPEQCWQQLAEDGCCSALLIDHE